jgi:transcription elongation GreA/GreB family factor
MSRAFVKELDGAEAEDELPDRPQGDHPNYATPAGLLRLEASIATAAQERERLAGQTDDIGAGARVKALDRELRYLRARVDRTVVVDPAAQSHADIRFGATVTLAADDGREHRYTIVGEDEACAPKGYVSWLSPLARAMLGKRIGDIVLWESPGGIQELEVTGFAYRAID